MTPPESIEERLRREAAAIPAPPQDALAARIIRRAAEDRAAAPPRAATQPRQTWTLYLSAAALAAAVVLGIRLLERPAANAHASAPEAPQFVSLPQLHLTPSAPAPERQPSAEAPDAHALAALDDVQGELDAFASDLAGGGRWIVSPIPHPPRLMR
jgi:hypothetical protein